MILSLISFPGGVNRGLVWWIALVAILRAVCDYWHAHREQLPEDLRPSLEAAALACDLACDAITAYDLEHKRGKYQQPGDVN